jgi:Ca2+-binding RTX toxin-like protein
MTLIINAINTQSTVFTVNNSSETWLLAAGKTIDSNTNGIVESANFHENIIEVNGDIQVHAAYIGVASYGSETKVLVGDGGTIAGTYGVYGYGDEFSLINNGSITGADTAVHVAGDFSSIVNHGEISGKIEAVSADKLNIVLGKDSTITEDTGDAIAIDSEAGQTARIVNHGSISAPDAGWALQGGDGKETFINSGTLNGDVMLGAGNDVFDNRGGTVGSNYIKGNEGNDTFILDGKIKIYELAGEGTDTIKSTISMNLSTSILSEFEIENLALLGKKNLNATGNALDNAIIGNSGNNRLSGLAGDDIMTGGKGADVFIFKNDFDHDTVHDFGRGADRIDLSDFSAVTSFADLMAHHVNKSGDDLIIHAGTDQLTLEHVSKADLHASDFIF